MFIIASVETDLDKGSGSKPKVFLRESTGLVKNVSFFDSISINLIYMSIGAGLAGIGFTTTLFPTMSGVNLVYASLISAVITIPQAVVYSMMTCRMPRTGADYVWVSRTLGGWFGSALTFMGITMETMPYIALIAISLVFAMGSVGLFFNPNSSAFLGLALPNTPADVGSTPIPQFGIAVTVFALLILLNIFLPKVGFKFVTACFVIGIIALILSMALLLSAGQSGVASIQLLKMAGTNFTAVENSYNGPGFSLVPTLLMIPFFFIFTYPWFNGTVAAGSELRGNNTRKWNAPISLLVATIITTAPFAIMYYVAGERFINGALANQNLVINYSFNYWTLAMGVAPDSLIAFIVGMGWIIWEVGIIAYGIILISRYLFAQSFDRFLPSKLSTISERFGSPIYAHIVDLVVTVVVIGLAIGFYGEAVNLYGNVAASMIFFAFVGVAAVIQAIRFEKGNARNTLAIAGILQAIVFVFVAFLFFEYAGIWGGNLLSYGYIIASFVGALAIYYVASDYNKQRGLDIGLVFKEIPPE